MLRKTLTRLTAALALALLLAATAPALLGAFGWQYPVVTTGSMAPGMPVGSVLIVQPTKELTIGEPVMFQLPEATTPVTHRVIALEDGIATTKGDANNAADSSPVTEADVIGRPVAQLDGWAADAWLAAQTIPGRIGIGALILLLLMPWLPSGSKTKTSASDSPPPTSEPLEAS